MLQAKNGTSLTCLSDALATRHRRVAFSAPAAKVTTRQENRLIVTNILIVAALGQLARMQKTGVDASFVYNENGLRVQKTVNGVETNYTLHGKRIHHMTQGENELHFFYDAHNRPAVVIYNGEVYSYVKSLQGDIVAILDSNGVVVVRYVYDAWGKPIGKTGTMASTLGTVQPFRYRGYVYDEETELYYLLTRYYSPNSSRFISPDSFASLSVGELKNRNLFAYCDNFPIACIDSNGQIGLTILGVMAIGGLIGGFVSAAYECCNQVFNEKEEDIGTIAANVGVAFVSGFVSGALNASPACRSVQAIGGAFISGVTYWASCKVNEREFDTSECVISSVTGGFFGLLGGDGLTHKDSPLRNAMESGKTQLIRETRRRNQEYAAQQRLRIQGRIDNIAWEASYRPFGIYWAGTVLGPVIKGICEPICEALEDWVIPVDDGTE